MAWRSTSRSRRRARSQPSCQPAHSFPSTLLGLRPAMWLRDSNRAARRRLIHDRRGVTAVEFGFVAFIFFVLLLGTVDLGRYQFTQQSLRDIVAEAARAGLITINQALALAPTATPACPSGGA